MSQVSDMSAREKSDESDRVWRALADPTRRAILDQLAERAHTTGELVARHPELCRTAVMKHVGVLETAGLLLVRREGRVRWNHLNPMPIQELYERWVAKHVRDTASGLSRLKALAEGKRGYKR
jgi:DNA-binding transcriptional ArsR family regulator